MDALMRCSGLWLFCTCADCTATVEYLKAWRGLSLAPLTDVNEQRERAMRRRRPRNAR